MLDANWLVRKSGCPAISITVTFCPSYDGKSALVCGDVLGVSMFACATIEEGVIQPRIISRTLIQDEIRVEEKRAPQSVLVEDRNG
jgi:hypothetical protein